MKADKNAVFIFGTGRMSPTMRRITRISNEYYRQKKGLADMGYPPEVIAKLEARIQQIHRTTTRSFEDAARLIFGEAREKFNDTVLKLKFVDLEANRWPSSIEEPPGGKE